MKLIRFLESLVELEVDLWVHEGRLRYRAPKGVLTKELLEQLTSWKTEILSFLSYSEEKNHQNSLLQSFSSRCQDIPLSFCQEEIWIAEQFSLEDSAFTISVALRFEGLLDVRLLNQSINEIIVRHESLRTIFEIKEGKPVQIVLPNLDIPLPIIDLRKFSGTEQKEKLSEQFNLDNQKQFDLVQGPLMRTKLYQLDALSHVMHIQVHHIIFDIASVEIFVQGLAKIYSALKTNKSLPFFEPNIQYSDLAILQRKKFESGVLDIKLAHWKKKLEGCSSTISLPTDYPQKPTHSFQVASKTFQLSRKLSEALRHLSRAEGVTLFMTLLAAFKILLYRYSGQDDISVGTPTLGRENNADRNMLGAFAYPLVLRTDLSGNLTFREFLAQVRNVALEAYAHQDVPFLEIVKSLPSQRNQNHNPLFQVMFSYPPQLEVVELPELKIIPMQDFLEASSGYDLVLGIMEKSKRLTGTLIYNVDLFNADTAERITQHFQVLLQEIVIDSEQRCSKLPILTPVETEQLLVNQSIDLVADNSSACIHQLIELQARKTPDAIALTFESQQMTYQELNVKADRLAYYLQSLGMEISSRVAVCLPPSQDTIIAILAILKAGGAYIILDTNDPLKYSASALEHTHATLLITQKQLIASFSQDNLPPVVCLEDIYSKLTQECSKLNHVSRQNLAYIHYTSNSAVLVEHQAVYYRLKWLQEQFSLTSEDVTILNMPLTVDSTVYKILWSLMVGSHIVIIPQEVKAIAWQKILNETGTNIVHLNPLELSNFLDDTQRCTKSSLRQVFISGGTIQESLIRRFINNFSCPLHHLYNLPETSIEFAFSTYSYERKLGLLKPDRFIGQSTDVAVYILDNLLQPAPIGVYGKIYLASPGLPCGYLDNSNTASQRFIQSPYHKTIHKHLLNTGQKGRWLNDRVLEIDTFNDRNRVWFKGHYINTVEIEAAILQLPSIEACVVQVQNTEKCVLVAYVVPSGVFSLHQIQVHLKANLPNCLLPDIYIPISSLPLTKTGRIDEEALMALPVIDDTSIRQLEVYVNNLPAVLQAAVVLQNNIEELPPLHLAELIPDWQSMTDNLAIVASEATEGKMRDCITPAVIDGEPLIINADTPTILSTVLQRAATQKSHLGISYIQDDGSEIRQSYSSLLLDAERMLTALRTLGLKPQDKVLFQIEDNQAFITSFWGCLLGGFVPVPLSVAINYENTSSGANKLLNAWQMLEQPLILTSQKLAPVISSLFSELELPNYRIESTEELILREPDHSWYVAQPNDLTLLLLTSGSTGEPKAVMHSHKSLLNRVIGTVQMNQFSNADISLNWLPLDHVGGIVMFHLRDIYLGCQQIHAPREIVLQDPLKWLDWVNKFRVTITWAPNFAYGLINQQVETISQRQWDLSSLRFILNAGEAIVTKTARQFLHLLSRHCLPLTAMHPAWGMSETASAVTFSPHFSLASTTDSDSFVEVGQPIPGISLKIVNQQNEIVTEGITGNLQVKGSSITSGYYQNQKLNQKAFTEDGWFETGDLGFLQAGQLTITGRSKDIIIINGINYYCHEIEAVVEDIPGVETSYTCACAVRDSKGNTDKLAIFFNTCFTSENQLVELLRNIRTRVVQEIEVNPSYLIPIGKDTIPKTTIGKIQHTKLKKLFETGEFEKICQRTDILTANANTLPDWFYQLAWHPQNIVSSSLQSLTGKCLIFVDQEGLAQQLINDLTQHQLLCISVEADSCFTKLDQQHYRIDPHNVEHYKRLFASLTEDKLIIDRVLHLWTYSPYEELKEQNTLELSQNLGVYSLTALCQALEQFQGEEHPVRLTIVSSYSQPTAEGDSIAWEKGTLVGLVKTISQEMFWLDCRHIDLPVQPATKNATLVLQELQAVEKQREVAYRNGQRLAPRLEKLDLSQIDKYPIPFQQGSMYLLSGGLGGIGVEVAAYLLKQYQARLLIVGRTKLPARSTWSTHIENNTPIAERIKSFQQLEQLGGEILYYTADICNREQLQEAVAQAEGQWQLKLEGILNLAGVYQEQMLAELSPEQLDAIIPPKVKGTWNLHQLIKNKSQGIFINFASVNSFFGGFRVGAYSAANRFLEYFTHYQRYHCSLDSYCLAWSMWDELGMSRNHLQTKALSRAQGYHIITKEQGLNSFRAVLHSRKPCVLIGIDGSHQRILRSTSHFRPLQKPCVYFTATEEIPSHLLEEWIVQNVSHEQSYCQFQQLSEIPTKETGIIDREKLLTFGSKNSGHHSSIRVKPRTDTERQLAQIWQDILGISQVYIDDDFFELGGNSLLATQIKSRVRDEFRTEIPIHNLFEATNIAQLAKCIETLQWSTNCISSSQEKRDQGSI